MDIFYVLVWNEADRCRQNDYDGPYSLERAIRTARQTVPFGRAEADKMRAELLNGTRVDSKGRYGARVSIYPACHLPDMPQNEAEADAYIRAFGTGRRWQDWVTR